MGQGSTSEVAQCGQLLLGVVDAADESVLVGRASAGPVDIGLHGVPEAQQREALDARHQVVARALNGGVEGDGERELLGFLGELMDHGNESAGGDGEVTSTDAGAVRGVEEAKGLQRLIVVGERLSLAHEDDAGDALAKVVSDMANLLVDLRRLERAGEACLACGAEGAAHATSGLGGGANGQLWARGHANALDRDAIIEAEQVLPAAVDGLLTNDLGGRTGRETRGKLRAKLGGQVGHLVEGLGVLGPEPLLDLLGSELGLAKLLHELGNLVMSEVSDRGGPCGGAAALVCHMKSTDLVYITVGGIWAGISVRRYGDAAFMP